MTITITIRGLEQGIAEVQSMLQKLSIVGSQIFPEVGNQMVTAMRTKAPVRTGFLRDNIVIQDVNNTILHILSGAEYSKYIEYGTWKMHPQPFFFPVAYTFIPEISRLMTAYLRQP